MINRTFYSIFQQGSRTYFYSSLFFPTMVKKDVFELYGFVRKADNYVDSLPQDKDGFERFKNTYYSAVEGEKTDDVVIDFFAGSCTTAQAVLELNREDGGHRRFIMVQLPEPLTKPEGELSTISDIAKERIRRVIAIIRNRAVAARV